MTIEINKVSASIGAEISGVDLAQPINADLFKEIRAALVEHQVIFFHNQQHIGPEHFLALARHFGEPIAHPAYHHVKGYPMINVLKNDPDNPPKIDTWHTDMTFLERPPLGSLLRCKVAPKHGGDTLFGSLSSAYQGLSKRMQRYLEGLRAIHSFAHGFRHSLAEPGGMDRLGDAARANAPMSHPVVRTHPESGRKGLFVNRLFTTHIEGLSEAESDAILAFLFDHIEVPEHSCRFHWQPGVIGMWDNRATVHRPVNDFWPDHRVMQRITIAGDRPV